MDKKSNWCVSDRHGAPCPSDNCTACADECSPDEQFFGTREEALEEHERRESASNAT